MQLATSALGSSDVSGLVERTTEYFRKELMLRQFINSQIWLRQKFYLLLPVDMRVDGNTHFIKKFAPPYLRHDFTVVDIGGGKNPFVDIATKQRLRLRVIGVDIDEQELAQAPSGAYDQVICADIQSFRGTAIADLVICQSLLEHVPETTITFAAIESMLKPGATAVVFVPSRNAVFARLNLLLPESLKRWLLFTIFPKTRRSQGFESYYNLCTPRDFSAIARRCSLVISQKHFYFINGYFSFFFPLYFLWRIWTGLFRAVRGTQAAETFSMAPTKSSRRLVF